MKTQSIELVRKDCQNVIAAQAVNLDKLKNTKLVITGGTGVMGTWLTELIATLNDEHDYKTKVVLISRSTERFEMSCPHLAKRNDVQLIKADVRHFVEFPLDANWIIHAAGTPDIREHATNPIEIMNSISEGTLSALKASDRCGDLRLFLNISSGLVYGGQPLELKDLFEDYNGAPKINLASSGYAEAKRYAETLCVTARSQLRIPVASLRPFAFVGPYQALDYPFAINNFLRDGLNGSSIRILGDGRTVRSYMYLSDMAFWVLRALVTAEEGMSYNLGSDTPISIEMLARQVSEYFSPTPDVQLKSASKDLGHHNSFIPNLERAKSKFGAKLTVDLNTAIDRTLQWLRIEAK